MIHPELNVKDRDEDICWPLPSWLQLWSRQQCGTCWEGTLSWPDSSTEPDRLWCHEWTRPGSPRPAAQEEVRDIHLTQVQLLHQFFNNDQFIVFCFCYSWMFELHCRWSLYVMWKHWMIFTVKSETSCVQQFNRYLHFTDLLLYYSVTVLLFIKIPVRHTLDNLFICL